MAESLFLRRPTIMMNSTNSSLSLPAGVTMGSNRSRRSSWSDSKVRNSD
jgi:hypothetical protein